MYLVWFLAFCLAASTRAQDANCDYSQDVEEGKKYHVYSPNYPNIYPPGIQCRWRAKCSPGFNCRLDCTDIDMPNTNGCTMDRLLVSKSGDPQLYSAERYCGRGSLTAVSNKQDMSVGLIAARNSPGGRMYCQLTAQAAAPPPDICRCGYKKTNRIVGGQETGINEYPMMAGLVELDSFRVKCGLTIISPRHLLTAAHCVSKDNSSTVAIVVGEHDVTTDDSPAMAYEILNINVHRLYDPNTFDYDIAILTTKHDMKFSEQVGPACLPFKFARESFAGKIVTALGWGTTFYGGPTSDVMMKVDLDVISQSTCKAMQSHYLSDNQMCTYTPNKDSCQFDSGGPLLYQDPITGLIYHVGIISGGQECGGKSPGLSTRVTAMLDWIVTQTAYNFCRK